MPYPSLLKEPTFPFTCAICGKDGMSWSKRTQTCGLRCRKGRNQQYVGRYARSGDKRRQERARIAAKAGKLYRTNEQRAADKAVKEAARLARREQPRSARKDQPSRECICCLGPFSPKNSNAACCSVTCRQRYESRRRKARLRGLAPVAITAAHLFRRGDKDCGLCGEPVDLGLRYPHPLSPTVDHIVPLTKGGAHHIDNTQLAHARCNTSKGNRYVA